MQKNIKRGQVWYHSPSVGFTGHIQGGPRPVIIVSNNVINQTSSVVLAVPCTTQVKRNFPTHVLFVLNDKISVALTEQVFRVDVNELVNLRYTLEDYIMSQVDEALKISLGFKSALTQSAHQSKTNSQSVNKFADKISNNSQPIGNQVDKFYSRYPNLKPENSVKHSKWTLNKMKELISDCDTAVHLETIAVKYKLSMSTLKKYYRKFKLIVDSSYKEEGAEYVPVSTKATC